MQVFVFFNILEIMPCVSGYCTDMISDNMYKSKHEIERLCRNDENCLAYDYSEHFGHGSLCGSTSTTEYDRYVICSKGEINLLEFFIRLD